MITKENAEKVLQRVIAGNEEHQDYKEVCAYAEQMKRLITGVGIEDDLKRFVQRETEEMFNQRVILTQIITPAICSMLMKPAYKIPRVKPSIKKIDFDTETNKDKNVEDKKTNLNKAMDSYYGKCGVDGFLEKRFIPLSYIDPNGFILTTFDKFDNRFEKAKPYPTFIPSIEAMNYDIADDELNWLITRKAAVYESYEGISSITDGKIYQMYTDKDIIEYIQTKVEIAGAVGTYVEEDGKRYYKLTETDVYVVNYYTPKAGGIQAKRIGTILDESTDGRTCVSPIHPAIPYLIKSIKSVSELDLSVTLHVFLQKISAVPRCQGDGVNKCDNGWTIDGHECKACGGSGKTTITSSQDDIEMLLPRDPNDAYDLSKLVKYVDIPISIVEFLDKYIDKIEQKCIKAIYSSEKFQSSIVVQTATENIGDMQSVYDALYPLAKQYSAMWIHTVRIIANLIDLSGIIVDHQFPKDFKFKSQDDLLSDLKLAADSGAPYFVRQDICNDIAELIFQDRPDELKKLQVKQRFNPFDGKTLDEINFIVANDLCSKKNKILWSESSTIFSELEEESLQTIPAADSTTPTTKPVWFYDLAYKKQKELVDKKVAEIITAIDEETPKAVPFGIPPGAGPEPPTA